MKGPDLEIHYTEDVECPELTKKIEAHLKREPQVEWAISLAEVYPKLMITHAYLIEDKPWADKPMEIATMKHPKLALMHAEKINNLELRRRVIAKARECLKANFDMQ